MGPSEVTLHSVLVYSATMWDEGKRCAIDFFYNIIACVCPCVQQEAEKFTNTQKTFACVSMKVVKLKFNYFVQREQSVASAEPFNMATY